MIDEGLLKEFKDFENRSHDYFSDFYDRIKDDRLFLGGSHFDENDNKRFGKSRLKMPVDVVSNTIRAIVNQYSSAPYSWLTTDETLNDIANRFLTTTAVKASIYQALRNSTRLWFGLP